MSQQSGDSWAITAASSIDEEDAQPLLIVEPCEPLEHYEEATTSSFRRWSYGVDFENAEQRRAWRVAMLLFVSLLLHNAPEGLAVAASALESTHLGLAVTLGIMIHNIPEGIAIAIPCLAARPDSPWLAFLLASGSGLAEPLGAAVALLFLRNQTRLPLENVLAFVTAIMIMVSLCELFPEANRHTKQGHGCFALGTILGIIVMTATELYLK
jgi:ZIP family zinc transporter